MTKINLAPDVRLDKLKTKRRNFMVTITAIIILAGMVAFILVLQGYKWSKIYLLDQTKKKIASTNDELKGYKDIEDMVVNIEQGTKAINNIEQSEPKWSRFFPVLEKVTPNDVQFLSLSQTDNKFTAQIKGRQLYSIPRLMNTLDSYKDEKTGRNLFKNVSVTSYSASGDAIDFSISFEMEQGILW